MLKPGDIICFNTEIKSNNTGFYSMSQFVRQTENSSCLEGLTIPKDVPVLLTNITRSHVKVKYKNRIVKLRRIDSRMYYAGEAAQILYGDVKC
jgi:hypothetical protein